jgi:hypothetical protein
VRTWWRETVGVPKYLVGVVLVSSGLGPLLAGAVAWKQVDFDHCLRDQAAAAAKRAEALAGPTDRERQAERVLLEPGGDPRVEAAEVRRARAELDRVRAEYPPLPPADC